MKGKILLVVGLGVGYVLGTRAGREKYDELVAKVQKVWNDPRVQKQANHVGDFVKDKAPDVADFVASNVKKATSRRTEAKPATRSAAKPATRSSSTRSSTPRSGSGSAPAKS